MDQEIKSIGVFGPDVMGFDIAFLYAMKGLPTLLFDAAKPMMESVMTMAEEGKKFYY